MAERKPLVVLDNNEVSELPAGDTLPGGGLTGGIIDGGSATTTYSGEPVFDFGSAS